MNLQHLLPHHLRAAIADNSPLLVPLGSVEYHGPHLPLGVDAIVAEELCQRVAGRVKAVVAPAFHYGPTGYAVTGPDQGTVDVTTERFGRHVKDILGSFWDIGWRWIIICAHHQGLDGPEALAVRQAAAEIAFEKTLVERGNAWWGGAPPVAGDNVFERIQVWPSVLPEAAATGTQMADHAGFYETSLMLAARPDVVDMTRLGPDSPWYTNAVTSKARLASREAGERMWTAMVDAWVGKISALSTPPITDP